MPSPAEPPSLATPTVTSPDFAPRVYTRLVPEPKLAGLSVIQMPVFCGRRSPNKRSAAQGGGVRGHIKSR